MARTVLEKGTPELVAAVESGKVAVSAAKEVAQMPTERQQEIVAQGPKAVVKAASEARESRKPAVVKAAADEPQEKTTGGIIGSLVAAVVDHPNRAAILLCIVERMDVDALSELHDVVDERLTALGV